VPASDKKGIVKKQGQPDPSYGREAREIKFLLEILVRYTLPVLFGRVFFGILFPRTLYSYGHE